MTEFEPDVVAAVTGHMNVDHAEESLLIVRAFAEPGATDARMTSVDSESGEWAVVIAGREQTVRIPWLEPISDRGLEPISDRGPEPISDRPALRTAVVALYQAACARLGVDHAPH